MGTLESAWVSIPLSVTQPQGCGLAMLPGVVTSPSHGTLSALSLSNVIYTPDPHYLGTDSFTLYALNAHAEMATRTFSVLITSSSTEFAGQPEGLFEYRDQLTSNEVRHLLCKYALCGNPELYQIGISQGRRALVSALMNYETSASTQGARTRTQSELGNTPESHAINIASLYSTTCAPEAAPAYALWSPQSAQLYWLDLLKNGSPLREHIALHLHNHLPINAAVNQNQGVGGGCSSHYTYKNYIDLLRYEALGKSASQAGEVALTGDYRELLRNITNDYQMALYLSQFQPRYLGSDNFYRWFIGVHNNNFAREILQVFSLGSVNVFSGLPNYTESDVQQVARALAGLTNEMSVDLRTAPELVAQPWRASPYGQTFGGLARFDASTRDTGTKTIFENSAVPGVRKQGDLQPADVIDSISKHDGYAYVPRMFFSRSVYPNPSAALVHSLDQEFRGAAEQRIPRFYQTLMNSSASFSPQARYGCISSGAEQLYRLLNTLQLRVTSRGAPIPQDANPDTNSTYWFLSDQLNLLGHPVLYSPSIFGYGECGDSGGEPNANNYGQAWLGTQQLLARYNLPFRTMKFYLEGSFPWMQPQAQEGFSAVSLFPPGNSAPTAAQLVQHFENLFGVTLSAAERSAVLSFLDPASASGRPAWNPGSLPIVKARVSGLVAIFGNLPEVNVR